ncbi:MAG: response regulator [Bacteriovoracaceae bacterium]|nr:response regulator [Bacteriovoracaceae bacterium]
MSKKAVNTKIFLALFFIGVFNVLGFLVLEWTAQKQVGLANLINLSGRQRMLSQRITLLLHEAHVNNANQEIKQDLENKLNLFIESDKVLRREAQERERNSNDSISSHYKNELNQFTDSFIKQVNIMKRSATNSDLNEFSSFSKSLLLKSLDRAVKLFESESELLSERLKITERLIAFICIASLILSYFFIFAPMRDQIIFREEKLKDAAEKAEDEAFYKSMFLANMSHELRTPLNGVLGVTDLLGSTSLNSEQREYINIINESGTTLLGIINNILDLTKLEIGKVELEEVHFSPEKLLKNLPLVFHYLIESKGLNVTLDAEGLPKVLIGDVTRINQILNNLLANAIKFTDKGSVKIIASYNNNHFSVTIKDSGIGMSKDVIAKVFEPFKQADISTTRNFGGTGLGLTITSELLYLMGGEISVESELNLGSSFHIRIPLKVGKIEDLEQITTNENEDLELKSQRVLVVDDNAINRNLLVRTLQRQNLDVKDAGSGIEAIDMLGKHKFDLVLMDYHMPGLNGVETFIKANDMYENLPPTIALTADLTEETKSLVLSSGMKEVIGKPLRKADLKKLLKKYLIG